jgi:hypothetical protein
VLCSSDFPAARNAEKPWAAQNAAGRRSVSAVATSENTLPANELQDRGIEETQPKKTTYPSKELDYWRPSIKEENPMITNPFQRKAYHAVAAALPFAVDPRKITER